MAVWVGSAAWVGPHLWALPDPTTDRNFYLDSALVGNGISDAVLTGGPVVSAVLGDGISLAVLTQPQPLTATLTFG